MTESRGVEDENYAKVVKRLRTKMKKWIETGPALGAAFSVVTTDGPLFSDGYGFRDMSKSAEVDEEIGNEDIGSQNETDSRPW